MDLEDILNGEDSDDDDILLDPKQLDIESLLQDDLSDEEEESRSIEPKASVSAVLEVAPIIANKPVASVTSTETVTSEYKVEHENGFSSELANELLQNYESELQDYVTSVSFKSLGVGIDDTDEKISEIIDDPHTAVPLVLQQALQQEAIEFGESSAFSKSKVSTALSALQTTRSRILPISNSNIKWDTLEFISNYLKKNSSFKQHGSGSASSIHVHNKFISIGTTKGFILLFDNAIKHGSETDRTYELKEVLGSSLPAPQSRCGGAVTSVEMCRTYFNSFPVLISGYSTGELALWDISKGTIIKRITDLHKGPISSVQFLLNVDTGFAEINNSNFDCYIVSSDQLGNLHRTRFAKSLWGSYSHDSSCLLDGTSGIVLQVSILSPMFQPGSLKKQKEIIMDASQRNLKASVSKSLGVLPIHSQFLAFSLATRTCIVQLSPLTKVIYKWSLPTVAMEGQHGSEQQKDELRSSMHWQWIPQGSDEEIQSAAPTCAPSLVRCYGSCLQILSFWLQDSYLGLHYGTNGDESGSAEYTFRVMEEQTFEGMQLVSVNWLSQTSIVLMSTSHIFILNRHLSIVEQCDLSPTILPHLEWKLHTNSLCAFNGSLHVLLQNNSLYKIQLQSCFEISDRLVQNGQWLEALNLVLESVQAIPLLLKTNAERIESCVINYVTLAIQHSAITSVSNRGSFGAIVKQSNAVSKTHYHLVAGVCIEYCVLIGRLDLLFNRIYGMFVSFDLQAVFLMSVEPFILAGRITSLPNSVMVDYFECYLEENRLRPLEKSVAHLFIQINEQELRSITQSLYDHDLHSSFLYAYAYGCNDFIGAFQATFAKCEHLTRNDGTVHQSSEGSDEVNSAVEETGYKLLLFALYLFEDKVFPRGISMVEYNEINKIKSSDENKDVFPWKVAILNLLTAETAGTYHSKLVDASTGVELVFGNCGEGKFPFLSFFSKLDLEALFYCLFKAADSILAVLGSTHKVSLPAQCLDRTAGDCSTATTVDMSSIFERIYSFCKTGYHGEAKDRIAGYYFDQFINIFINFQGPLPFDLLKDLLQYINQQKPIPKRGCYEDIVAQVIEKQAKYHQHAALKGILLTHNFWQSMLVLKQQPRFMYQPLDFQSALKFYCSLQDGRFQSSGSEYGPLVFTYIVAQIEYLLASSMDVEEDDQLTLFVSAITNNIIPLARISFEETKTIICKYFKGSDCINDIILVTSQHGETKLQFDILDGLVSFWLQERAQQSDRRINIATLGELFNNRSIVQYFTLLAKFDSSNVLSFLRAANGLYPVEECLIICRDVYSIPDGTAYLFQLGGDHKGALNVMLKEFSSKIKMCKKNIDTQLRNGRSAQSHSYSQSQESTEYEIISHILTKQGTDRVQFCCRLPMYAVLSHIVSFLADICGNAQVDDENAGPDNDWDDRDDNCKMFFRAFDHLLLERQSIRSGTASSSGEITIILIGLMLQTLMTRMKGMNFITPVDIIRRVTATEMNSSGIRLGEFKDVMLNMMSDLESEYSLNSVVKRIVQKDLMKIYREKHTKMRRPCYVAGRDGQIEFLDVDLSSKQAEQASRRGVSHSTFPRKKSTRWLLANKNTKIGTPLNTCLPGDVSAFSINLDVRKPGKMQRNAMHHATLVYDNL